MWQAEGARRGEGVVCVQQTAHVNIVEYLKLSTAIQI
jgi:hypothetical protein